MNLWILVAVLGGLLGLIGTATVYRDYRRGVIGRRELLLSLLAAAMVMVVACSSILLGRPNDPTPGFAIFFPLWLALLAAIRRRRAKRTEQHQDPQG